MPLIWEADVLLLEELAGEVWNDAAFPGYEMLEPFREEPSSRLVIIGYFPRGTFASRKDNARDKMIGRIASKRIVTRDQIEFVDGGEAPDGRLSFRFYKVPMGAERPNP